MRLCWGVVFIGFVLYLASYPIFLLAYPVPEYLIYRSPQCYRLAEWVILRTPLQSCVLEWSSFIGSRSQLEMQVWYFGQGINENLINDMHFNIQQ